MQIHSIFGDLQQLGYNDHSILEVENPLFIQKGDDGLISGIGTGVAIVVDGIFRGMYSLLNGVADVGGEIF